MFGRAWLRKDSGSIFMDLFPLMMSIALNIVIENMFDKQITFAFSIVAKVQKIWHISH